MSRERQGDIRVVFFDAAGTLFHVKGSVGQIYLDHAVKYGVKVSPNALQQGFQRAFADSPPMAFSVAEPKQIKACERLWWFDLVHNVFYRAGMFEGFDQYFDEVFDYFSRADSWALYPESMATLQALEQRGLELGVVSNFDSRLYEILIGLGIDRFFDSVTISSIAGAAKPSPQIFQRALTKHQAAASEALHVGDSLREDAQGAAAAGLKALLLQREPAPVLLSGVEAIRTLTEIIAFIDKR